MSQEPQERPPTDVDVDAERLVVEDEQSDPQTRPYVAEDDEPVPGRPDPDRFVEENAATSLDQPSDEIG
ncbi:hypothetical protein [Marmoricola sp. RAF53]|uniref:hypothetical protein n=1 Tax=Marmoricola sp. RAF53 TaxID=3233059 RepID=UPI003F983B90